MNSKWTMRLVGAPIAAAVLVGLAGGIAHANPGGTTAANGSASGAGTQSPTSSQQTAAPSTNASSAAPSARIIARPKPFDATVGQPFAKNPYPQPNPFPGFPGNPWAQ
jgi:hypothetical protein